MKSSSNSQQYNTCSEPVIDETALADEEDPDVIGASEQPAPATVDKILRAPNNNKKKQWKLIILVAAVIVVVAVAATAALVVGMHHKNDNDKNDSALGLSSPVSTSDEDDSRNNKTQEPPIANTENEEQTQVPAPIESTEEEPTEEVTTEEPPPVPADEGDEAGTTTSSPTNDLCANAIEVLLTDTTTTESAAAVTINGTTLFSTLEETMLDPDTSFCNWPWLSGVWYMIRGRGAGIRISTCENAEMNRSLDLYVYKGGDDDDDDGDGDGDNDNCGSLSCFENYSRGCTDTYGQSILTWFGEVDQTYYVYVAQADYAQGQFSLRVTEFDPPNNDVCTGATSLVVGEVSTTVSTQNATAEFITDNDAMSNEYYDLLPGVFYTVVGTGTFLKATVLCLNMEQTRVYVYQGGCENLQMIGFSQTCQPDSFVYWNSVEGEVYHILYLSSSEQSNVLTIVPFETPENDLCSNAIVLTLTDTVATITGTTNQSTFEDLGYSRNVWNINGTESFGFDGFHVVDQERAICDYRQSPGVWYTVQGRGAGIRVSTCDQDSNSTAVLSVFQGQSCGSLNCVINYPTRCGDQIQQNTLTWFGEVDQTYYIYVATTDHMYAQGPFTLQVSEFETPDNDVCAGANTLANGGSSVVSVQNATAEFLGNGGLYDWSGDLLPGIFYDVVGTGNVMKVAAPCNNTSVNRIFVYQGDCDEKVMVGEKVVCEPDSAAYWESAKDEIYHVLFQSNSYEPVDLTVTEERPELNDLCLGATGPVPVGSVVEGDTSVARWSGQYRRVRRSERELFSVAQPGLYYTVLGTGGTLQVSVPCMEEFGEPSVFVDFFAVACSYDQREYVTATRTSWCDPDYSVTWQTAEGELYFIHVTPGMYPGPFQFTVTEAVS